MKPKDFLAGAYAALGLCIESLARCLGGWDVYLGVLTVAMALDYLSGVLLAALWHKSPKTPTGGLESRAGWKGLCRKGMTAAFVGVGYGLDLVSGLGYVRKLVILGFLMNELLSLMENAGLMGMELPGVLAETIELLSRKSEQEEGK